MSNSRLVVIHHCYLLVVELQMSVTDQSMTNLLGLTKSPLRPCYRMLLIDFKQTCCVREMKGRGYVEYSHATRPNASRAAFLGVK